MGLFDFFKKDMTEFKFNNETLRIAVKKWCKNENVPHVFDEFLDALKRSNNP